MAFTVDIKKQLKDFNLEAAFQTQRGCLGILGASGCGKSMTLKAIAGIETLQSGKIIKDDKIFFDSKARINLKPQKRKTGFLFQNYALFPNMTVEENILAGLGKNTAVNREKAREAIKRYHLTGLEKRYPRKLSGGQQQRTALARILVCEPEILLLDEPFSALDAYLKEELQMELLDTLREFEGYAILVTHDRDEAYKLCDNLMIMENGRVITSGNTKEMFRSPKNYQTARLTGCKNLSKAEKTGENQVYAADWEMELTVIGPVPEKIEYIGIRAHDFVPVFEGENKENCFFLDHLQIIDAPFEENFIFRTKNGARIWWKADREVRKSEELPCHLFAAPDKIMLL